MNNRAVSNALGFILILSIVLVSVTIIFTSGFSQVQELRADEKEQNARRAMFVVHQNLKDVYIQGVPGRGTEISLKNSQLELIDTTQITIQVKMPNGNTITNSTTTKVLTYQATDKRAYSIDSGGLISHGEESGLMKQSPPMTFDTDRTVISFVTLKGNGSVGGETVVYTVFRREKMELLTYKTASSGSIDIEITVNASQARAAAWARYFTDVGLTGVDTDATDGTITYQYETDSVFIRESVIDVQFE